MEALHQGGRAGLLGAGNVTLEQLHGLRQLRAVELLERIATPAARNGPPRRRSAGRRRPPCNGFGGAAVQRPNATPSRSGSRSAASGFDLERRPLERPGSLTRKVGPA
jgi:hypothetical protein